MQIISFQKNNHTLQEIVQGRYGRIISYVDYEEVTPENVLKILSETIGNFNTNRAVARYLWNYKNGDQPILYRKKLVRDDIVNKVVENHAYEIVQFNVAQTYGEPIQYVSTSKKESVNKAVDALNNYMKGAFKYQRNVKQGEWKSAVGTSFLAIQRTGNNEKPFRITVPTPLNTYVVYSGFTGEALLAVQELKDTDGEQYYLCFSDTKTFKVKRGKLLNFTDSKGKESNYQLHAFGGIPIVEIPNNQDCLSDVEIVVTLLDSINTMQSNRMDGVEQFIQSWIKFINCEVDEEQFRKMKQEGALVVKSNNGSDNKADVDVMTQELNQTQSQVAKDDLWDNAQNILAMPQTENQNSGGDSAGAVSLRAGWDHARGRARLKDSYVMEAEMKFAQIALNVLRIAEKDLKISTDDFTVNILHSPTDNMYTKAQALQTMLQSGVHPLVATTTCGLWGDSEKVYLQSQPYFDAVFNKNYGNEGQSLGQPQKEEFKNTTGKPTTDL